MRSWPIVILVVMLAGAAAAVAAGASPLDPRPRATAAGSCARPYRASSPWNRPIPAGPRYDASSGFHIGSAFGDERLSSDPTQYTYPVYYVDRSTPRQSVHLNGYFSHVRRGGHGLHVQSGGSVRLPMPAGAVAAEGSDGQIILIDRSTGEEWGMWQAYKDGGGRWTIENGYRYSTRWSGVPPRGFGSRGAGVPYLTGLVRPCEIRRGRIDHALAFAYDDPTPRHIYPATKSDGGSGDSADLPEGARLQLDPSLSRGDLARMGCRRACLTIARALQRYGMYVIDHSGHAKIMLEYESTAHWHGRLGADTVRPLPMSRFKVLAMP